MATRLNANNIEMGSVTTAQRDAISSPPTGATVYNTTTESVEVFNGTTWVSIGFAGATTQYFVFTSPGTATLTSTYAFNPAATVDMFHMTPGNNGGSGQGGCGYVDNCGRGGGGGSSGVLNYKVGRTMAQTGSSIPVTIPSIPGPAMPGPQPGGGPYSGGGVPGSGGAPGGAAGQDASFTIAPFQPYFPDYILSSGEGGPATPGSPNSGFAGSGGSSGGGGLVVTPNTSLPSSDAPPTNASITGSQGNYGGNICGRQPGVPGYGGQGYGAAGGGGSGGGECNGGTSGGGGGGSGAPGIMIIRVSGYTG